MNENSEPAGHFTLSIEQVEGYEFRVRFDKPTHQDLLLDEPPPLGQDRAPNPARLLAASIAGCLSASLVFCLTKAKLPPEALSAAVDVELVRNERRRLRIGSVSVRLKPRMGTDSGDFGGCLKLFEDYCVVTESVRKGIDVRVSVEPQV